MSLTVMSKVGKKRTLVIPKAIAEKIGLNEECRVKITVEEGRIIVEPMCDAVWLSLYGKKLTKITLEELERESIEQQEKYINLS
ncbi:AbrB/MazE/SpoVT family DNA-binding domain-containing protein [Candidatus Bathyarchaeota archaeon]|nr:AbrB/MazE/SpoVT family DNA-binding domain-containing protein [Candidatus Bathyarchaeota archaeon]MBS7618519.1 AbrB/MazE/SpoVT family DNA-binding domain-containing protein [Candidatus Bathyarchaeota archaeon]